MRTLLISYAHASVFSVRYWRCTGTRFYRSYNHDAYSLRIGPSVGPSASWRGSPTPTIPSSITFSFVRSPGLSSGYSHPTLSARIRVLSSVSDASRWSFIETREWAWYFFLLVRESKQGLSLPCFMYVGNAASRYFPSIKLHPVSSP
jgi:hypothetical protein